MEVPAPPWHGGGVVPPYPLHHQFTMHIPPLPWFTMFHPDHHHNLSPTLPYTVTISSVSSTPLTSLSFFCHTFYQHRPIVALSEVGQNRPEVPCQPTYNRPTTVVELSKAGKIRPRAPFCQHRPTVALAKADQDRPGGANWVTWHVRVC